MSSDRLVTDHYARGDLSSALLAALQAAGKDPDRLTLEDLAPVDEFHVRGREATAELTGALGLAPGMRVLDVGSGIGGASRYVAATYDCAVVGIDLTEEYCRTAALLADRVGLGDRVEYRTGNALAMPFADALFEAAFTQHAAMNIEDKARLYREIWRVLKPGARFGIYDLLQGDGGEVLYPVPWARTEAASFMVTPTELRPLLEAAGLEILSWRDTTAEGRGWFKEMGARIEREGPPRLGFHLLLGPEFMEMARNQVRNFVEDRIAATEVICRKP
jgi:SAM-dependent methyltransferase